MFVVIWSPSAMNDFAQFSLLHPERWKDINAADQEIDKKLRKDPMQYGRHLSEGLWSIVVEPLAVYYSIDGKKVDVTSVGWIET